MQRAQPILQYVTFEAVDTLAINTDDGTSVKLDGYIYAGVSAEVETIGALYATAIRHYPLAVSCHIACEPEAIDEAFCALWAAVSVVPKWTVVQAVEDASALPIEQHSAEST